MAMTVFGGRDILAKERDKQLRKFVKDGTEPTLKDPMTQGLLEFLRNSKMLEIMRETQSEHSK